MNAERREAADLDRRILALLQSTGAVWHADPDLLDDLLLDVFAYQARWNPFYGRYAAERGATPGRLSSWQEIPPVPARAFGRLRMATFAGEAVRSFRSSGTSGGPRAVLELDTLDLYDAALYPAFVRHLLPDRAALSWVALLPDPEEARDSSLAYMIGSAARRTGAAPSYWVREGALDIAGARSTLAALARAREPVLLLGTAIALLAITDALAAEKARIALAPGSRVMETGGFKGLRRTVERQALYHAISGRLEIPMTSIVGEYGMTEMVSQFYDTTLCDTMTQANAVTGDDVSSRAMEPPPWVRSLVLDPNTLEPVGYGEEGVLLHFDPAARSSAVALLTEDRGRRRGSGFELRGRMPGAEARGCSLALDEILRLGADS